MGTKRRRLHPVDQFSGDWLIGIDVPEVGLVLVAASRLQAAPPSAVRDAHGATVQGATEAVPTGYGSAHGRVDVGDAKAAGFANVGE